jgi:hypothetical protein
LDSVVLVHVPVTLALVTVMPQFVVAGAAAVVQQAVVCAPTLLMFTGNVVVNVFDAGHTIVPNPWSKVPLP